MGSKKNISKFLGAFILVLALSFSTNSYAGKNDKSNDKSYDKSNDRSYDKSNDGPKSVPLDGGLSILLLGAAAFGVKKLRK